MHAMQTLWPARSAAPLDDGRNLIVCVGDRLGGCLLAL
jgi:hypothetical protein